MQKLNWREIKEHIKIIHLLGDIAEIQHRSLWLQSP